MDRIRIRGGHRLAGEIPISGAKNAALKLMAASILTAEPLTLTNVPRLADVRAMAELLVSFGIQVQVTLAGGFGEGDTMRFEASRISSVFASYDMVRKMRASFQVLAPLLARMGEAKVSLPGGCAIGARPVELHLNALEAMGAKIELAEGYVTATAPDGLKGAEIVFPFVSVGATETAMMAATLARGTTKIVNAAREPEISDLGNLLTAMGAEIWGLGSSEST
ncbi:MAG: UDP-N-acetylglucosamine 1-carboxyvinyltransferase, partial [Alphaproteobacteria bacterium]|nr:UDP-N-acetylglucosamine 1-carboxyvinyltransferase [Alphaproteobacteria bacterium]